MTNAVPKRAFWTFVGVLAISAVAEMSLHNSALVRTIPDVLRIFGTTTGLAFGVRVSHLIYQTDSNGRPFRKFLAVAMVPFAFAALGSYYVRIGYEVYAFAGVDREFYQQIVDVRSTDSKYQFSAHGVPRGGNRSIEILIDSQLYGMIEPYRQPGRDCIALAGEVGRDGVKRVRVPTIFFDTLVGVRRLRNCANEPSR